MKAPLFLTILAFPLLCPAEDQPSPQDLFRDALYAEEVTGDAEAALESYQTLTKRLEEHRALAARSLFRQAECLRKLDRDEEAVTLYRRLLTRYPEEEDVAMLAQQNLLALGHEAEAPAAAPDRDEQDERMAELKKRITQSPDLINAPAPGEDLPPLHLAAKNGQLKVLEFLVKEGADLLINWETQDHGDGYPLTFAASAGHLAACQLLTEAGGADDEAGSDALEKAVRKKRNHIIDYLCSNNILPNFSALKAALYYDDNSNTLSRLISAFSEGGITMSDKLSEDNLRNLTNLSIDLGKRSLLHILIKQEVPLSEYLYDETVDFGNEVKKGVLEMAFSTALHRTNEYSFIIIEDLLQAGITWAPGRSAEEFMKRAISFNSPHSPEVLALLLKHGGDPNLHFPPDLSLLGLALERTNSPNEEEKERAQKMIEILLSGGASWKKAGKHILHQCVRLDAGDSLRQALEEGVSPNHKDKEGRTPADLAVEQERVECLRILREFQAELNPKSLFTLIEDLPEQRRTMTLGGPLQPISKKISDPEIERLLATLHAALAFKPSLEVETQVHLNHAQSSLNLTLLSAICRKDCSTTDSIGYQFLKALLEAGANPNGSVKERADRWPENHTHPLNLLLLEDGKTNRSQRISGSISGSPAKGPLPIDAIKLLLKQGSNPKLAYLANHDLYLNTNSNGDTTLREGTREIFPLLWHAAHFDLNHNPKRPKQVALSYGLPALEGFLDFSRPSLLGRGAPEPFFLPFSEKENNDSAPTFGAILKKLRTEYEGKLDLEKPFTINRLTDGEESTITLDPTQPESARFQLQWGDIVEIP
ncbi:ankyrin repeat domain-containing protein [Roseibacillus ishigakijimensis]|uniref:Ankyrin repeat domain-containing protein n=1 Tax=Roseibacillus ishigakijimensis TaxID=454146 RepID=A0A934VK51_9BACT|nr:ankyrin repeat domain-containing protein [Roseibacillus ishigakijimensis]MBK1833284.1 ankyrin repeat domain-containing protein [Roseibacillus ishigakijimensis]